MAAGHSAPARSENLELVINRVFDAPRALVFKAWIDPEQLAHWWGPHGFTLPACKIDPRPGGAYRFSMRSPEGTNHYSSGVFREFVEPERIVFVGGWEDDQGKVKVEMQTTVTFAEEGGKTRLTLCQVGLESVTARDAHRGGWTGSFERLASYLASA